MDFQTKVQVVANAVQQIVALIASLYAVFGHGRAIKALQAGQQLPQQAGGSSNGVD